jgi:excisionase family DNA binding protein
MLLSIKQVAAKLHLGQTTVYGLCRQRKLRHFRVGLGRGAIRIDERDLEEYLKGAMAGPELVQPLPPRERFKHLRVS